MKMDREFEYYAFGKNIDGIGIKKRTIACDFDLPLARFVQKHRNPPVFFSPNGRTSRFFTDHSRLYYTPEEYRRIKRGERIVRIIRRLDSLHARVFERTKIFAFDVPGSKRHSYLHRRYLDFREYAGGLARNPAAGLTAARMWKISVVASVIFGMFIMTMIYRHLGQSVLARIGEEAEKSETTEAIKEETDYSIIENETITRIFFDIEQFKTEELEKEILQMVKGHPIEKMVPLIANHDRTVVAFLIGIAKQESNWGKRVPVYKGQDCLNYWGYRGKNPVGSGGHSCFASPEDAVNTVAKRLEFLVKNQNRNTPEKMILWKCGDCSWDTRQNMQRWINAVSIYFHQLNKEE